VTRRIEPLSQHGKSAIQHAPGRVCESPECDTHLSIYNGSSLCSVHEGLAGQGKPPLGRGPLLGQQTSGR